MNNELTVISLLFAAVNALVGTLFANHKGVWVSGREFNDLKQRCAQLEAKDVEWETKYDRLNERYVAAVQAGHTAINAIDKLGKVG